MPRQPKQKNLPKNLDGYQSLQCFDDYVQLIEKTINGVIHGEIERQSAHTVAVLTGYGIQSLREASGGRPKISVFMRDLNQVKIESMTQEQQMRFLQGNEEIQMEIMKEIHKDDVIETTAKVVVTKAPVARLNTKLISEVSGIPTETITDVLAGVPTEAVEPTDDYAKHVWTKTAGGTGRYCVNCGHEAAELTAEDMTAHCSSEWGLP